MSAQVVLLRDPARAQATVHALEHVGLTAFCTPLIFTVWPADTTALRHRVDELVAGGYDWLVLTSATTVKALHQVLGHRQLPQGLQLATVGTHTAEVAKDLLGISPSFTPSVQSAAGMSRQWVLPDDARIYYPHGDLASSTLSDWLATQKVHCTEVIAYRTVRDAQGLIQIDPRPVPADVQVLAADELIRNLNEVDAAIFTAPSIVRHFAALVVKQPQHLATVAIGKPTAAALEQLGWQVDAIAESPTPLGLTHATTRALAEHGHNEFLATRTGE